MSRIVEYFTCDHCGEVLIEDYEKTGMIFDLDENEHCIGFACPRCGEYNPRKCGEE